MRFATERIFRKRLGQEISLPNETKRARTWDIVFRFRTQSVKSVIRMAIAIVTVTVIVIVTLAIIVIVTVLILVVIRVTVIIVVTVVLAIMVISIY